MLVRAATLTQLVVGQLQTVQRVLHPLGKKMYQSLSTSCFAAWLFNAFYLYENHRWGDLIASAIVFPIGILHGFYLFWPK